MAEITKSAGAKTVDKTAAKPKADPAAKSAAQAQPTAEQVDAPADPAPATEMEASGALIEPAIVEAVETTHPAVDDNPRKGTTAVQNQIDFNDPTISQNEAVLKNLGEEPSAAEDRNPD